MITFLKGVSMMFKKIFGKLIRGVPDLPTTAEESAASGEFVPESELHGVINAAADEGFSFVPWRVDADGEQWYRKVPTVHAMAIDDEQTDVLVEDDENEVLAEDDDEFFGDDDNDSDDADNGTDGVYHDDDSDYEET